MEQLTGSIVALVTPMHEDGSVDYPALRRLIDWHIDEGTDCLGVVGTTGESPTVDVEEHCEIIRVSVEQAKGRVPVMAGSGANSTRRRSNWPSSPRASAPTAQLQVVPYYNKPTQEGLYQHFKAIAEAVGDLPDRAVQRARPHRGGHGARHRAAPGAGARHHRHQGSHRQHRAGPVADPRPAEGLRRLFRATTPPPWRCMLCGGQGNISVTANVAPRKMHELCVAALAGDVATAMQHPVRTDAAAPQPVRRTQPDSH